MDDGEHENANQSARRGWLHNRLEVGLNILSGYWTRAAEYCHSDSLEWRSDRAGTIQSWHRAREKFTLLAKNVKILVLTNLYPPHHAGTFDFRCQSIAEALQKRGHEVSVLTSNHGMNTEQRDQEIERRLHLNGVHGHPSIKGFRELAHLEQANHQVLRESIASFEPDLIHVFSLEGLPKSFIFALRHAQVPTVYDVADYSLMAGLLRDPWLRWWNRKPAPLLGGLWRACLELCGQRRRFDKSAPTRMMVGYDRLPAL